MDRQDHASTRLTGCCQNTVQLKLTVPITIIARLRACKGLLHKDVGGRDADALEDDHLRRQRPFAQRLAVAHEPRHPPQLLLFEGKEYHLL